MEAEKNLIGEGKGGKSIEERASSNGTIIGMVVGIHSVGQGNLHLLLFLQVKIISSVGNRIFQLLSICDSEAYPIGHFASSSGG